MQQAFLPDKFQTGKQDYLFRVTLFSRQFSSKTPEKRCHLHSNHNFRNHWDKFWCNPIYFSRHKCLTLYKTKNLEAFAPRNDFSLCCKHLNRMITSQWASQDKLLRQAKKNARSFHYKIIIVKTQPRVIDLIQNLFAICNIHTHTCTRLFKAFKNKNKYLKRMLWKGSLRGWPYLSVKNSQKKNLKNILS